MESIEQIDALFSGIELADLSTNRWFTESVPSIPSSRMLLSRDATGSNCVFIKGSLESFGRLPLLANIEHKSDASDALTGERFSALRIAAPPIPDGNIAVSHIVYEFIRQVIEDPGVDNASLVRRVSWILEVLGRQGAPMSPEKQRGLLAECLLLSELLTRGRAAGVGPEAVIDRWVSGRRDFTGGGIAIEVKATAYMTRRHHVSSLDQLDTDDETESVFIYSAGLRHDPSGPRSLTEYIEAIEAQLVTPSGDRLPTAADAFREKLGSAGYDDSHEGLYRSGPGILQSTTLPPRLFRVEDLGRLQTTSFKNDELPTGILSVSYELEITSEPLSRLEADQVLDSMLRT